MLSTCIMYIDKVLSKSFFVSLYVIPQIKLHPNSCQYSLMNYFGKKSSLDQHVKRKHSNEPIKVLHKPKPAPKQCPHCDKVLFMIIIVNYLYYRCY